MIYSIIIHHRGGSKQFQSKRKFLAYYYTISDKSFDTVKVSRQLNNHLDKRVRKGDAVKCVAAID